MPTDPIAVEIEAKVDEAQQVLERAAHYTRLFGGGLEVLDECERQVKKWGIQRHSDGTGRGYGKDVLRQLQNELRFGRIDRVAADAARDRCNYADREGNLTWEHIATEEFFEALEEDDPAKLRTELIQLEAVLRSWRADIDSREATA